MKTSNLTSKLTGDLRSELNRELQCFHLRLRETWRLKPSGSQGWDTAVLISDWQRVKWHRLSEGQSDNIYQNLWSLPSWLDIIANTETHRNIFMQRHAHWHVGYESKREREQAGWPKRKNDHIPAARKKIRTAALSHKGKTRKTDNAPS